MRNILVYVMVAFTLLCPYSVCGASCSGSSYAGENSVSSVANSLDTTTGAQFLTIDYEINCCGVLSQWEISAGATGTIDLQVWRPTGSPLEYTLVGQNSQTVTSTGIKSYSISELDRILIESGDVLGWYSPGTAIVNHKTGGNRNDNNYRESIGSASIGDTQTFSTQLVDRDFAIKAILSASSNFPFFDNLDSTISLFKCNLTTGTIVYIVNASDADINDTISVSLNSVLPFSDFTFDPATGEVTATTSSFSSLSYTLSFTAIDSCTNTATGTLTINLTNNAPVFDNLHNSVSVSKSSLNPGSLVFTISASDPDENDNVTLSLDSVTPSSDFTLDAITGEVTAVISTYSSAVSYTVSVTVTDTCFDTASGTLTINITNSAPVIHSLPDTVDISESAVDETNLHTINVTDTDGDDVTCSFTTSPLTTVFFIKYLNIGGSLFSSVTLRANPSLNYSYQSAYNIDVTCDDNDGGSATETLYVYVLQNSVPVILNLQNHTSIVSSLPSNTVVFEVIASDPEGDQLYFSLQCSVAAHCPFSIYSTGFVLLDSSLIGTSTAGYELDIVVSDDYTSSGYHRLTIFVTDLNSAPVINNLPMTIQVNEDTTTSTLIYTLSVYDSDGDTDHTFSASFIPSVGSSFFSLNTSSGDLSLASTLNYLTQDKTYTVTCTASDAQDTSTGSTLTIEIVDVNQTPALYQSDYQVEQDEGSAGSTFPDPQYIVVDPDSDDLTYSFVGGDSTAGFLVNSTTGIVSYTIDYDVDDTSKNTSLVWLIGISDPDGLSVTATLTVSILDTNDNVPVFDASAYSAEVYSDAALGSTVLTTTATDDDITSENSQLQCTTLSTTLFQCQDNGDILVRNDLSSYVGTVVSFTIRMSNPNINSYDSASVRIDIIHPPGSARFFSKGANIAWLTFLCILVLILFLGAGYLAYKFWGTTAGSYNGVQVAPRGTKMPRKAPRGRPSDEKKQRPTTTSTIVSFQRSTLTPTDIQIRPGERDNPNATWDAWKIDDWF